MIRFALVTLAIYLIARPQLHKFFEENSDDILKHRENLIKYAAGATLLATAISLLPGVLMHHYLRSNGFFAYEVFQADQSAFQVLSLNAWAIVLLLSGSLFGVLPALAIGADKGFIISVFLLNVFCATLVVIAAISSGDWLILATLLIPLLVALYASFWLKSTIAMKARRWSIPLALACALMIFPALMPSAASRLTSSVLSQLDIGGFNILLRDLKYPGDKPAEKYWLLLRTNDRLYVREFGASPTGSQRATVIALEDYSIVRAD